MLLFLCICFTMSPLDFLGSGATAPDLPIISKNLFAIVKSSLDLNLCYRKGELSQKAYTQE